MNWIKSNWGWLAVIVLATIPLLEIANLIQIDFSAKSRAWIWMDPVVFPPRNPGEPAHQISGLNLSVKLTGEWAIRWMVIVLSLTPFAILTGKKPSLWVRQAAGVAAFVFAALHLLFFCFDKGFAETFSEKSFVFGLVATMIMMVLAITSSSKAMKMLRKSWKKLHRFAYLAAALAILHVATLKHADWEPYLIILAFGFLIRVWHARGKILSLRSKKIVTL